MSPEPPAEEGEERCLECGESAGSTSLIARLRAENEELRKHDTECCQQEGSYHLMIEKERDAARAESEGLKNQIIEFQLGLIHNKATQLSIELDEARAELEEALSKCDLAASVLNSNEDRANSVHMATILRDFIAEARRVLGEGQK